MRLADRLSALVLLCARRAVLIVLAGLVLGAVCAALAAGRLNVTTDVDGLFDAKLPWKRHEAELKRLFPQNTDLLVAVIDAANPEEADATAAGLAAALAADTAHFRTVRRPDASPFFDKNGLLFLDRTELGRLLDQTIDAQPFLGQLAADPSARGLFSALALLGMGVERGQAELAPYETALRGFHASMESVLAGRPRPLSWQRLLSGPAAELAGPYRFVLAQPRLDYGALQPGGAATAAMRDAITRQEFVQAGTARVRITGGVALADEEFGTVAEGAVWGLAGSTALVALWLWLAVRSWRLALPVLGTLLLGLVVTTGLAAVTVGTLNLISVAFAVLFVGIAVDFAIQFGTRFREAQSRHGQDIQAPGQGHVAAALAWTARHAGVQIMVAAAATASGFLAFVPTSFTGVAELGFIAGAGMLVAFACTMTFLPAATALCRPRPAAAEPGLALLRVLDEPLRHLRWPVLLIAGVLAGLGAATLPRLRFDSDPLHTKDANTEAMRTLRDLMDQPLSNPYSVDVLAPNLASATALAAKLRALPLVGQAVTLSSLVPDDQPAKLALLADTANLLAPTLAPRMPAAPVTAADLRLAATTALAQIDRALPKLPPGHPLALIAADLRALAAAPDATLLAANAALTRFLPSQLAQLRLALSAEPVLIGGIPPDLVRDWRLPDGRVRVQAIAKPEARDSAGLQRLVEQVRSIAPDAGGTAVTVTETARTITRAFRHAAIGAVIAITAILALALRRVLDVALVLAALLLSGLLTVLMCVLLPLTLNFANIIALPLLLGIGVSFNIYFVMNWREGDRAPLGSATARGVLFSALTTGTAFGSLALSRHPGTASMGYLLLVSLGATLTTTLLALPALLAAVPSRIRIAVAGR